MNRRELFKGMIGAPVAANTEPADLIEITTYDDWPRRRYLDPSTGEMIIEMNAMFIDAAIKSYKRGNLLELEANTRRRLP